jgi:hypothetical protein
MDKRAEAYVRLVHAASNLGQLADLTNRELVGGVTLTSAGPVLLMRALNREGQVMAEVQRAVAWQTIEDAVVDPLDTAVQDMRHAIMDRRTH